MDNLLQESMGGNNTETHLGIDESHQNIKSAEDMSTSPILDNKRICLIGSVVDDKITVEAAQSLNLPIITSETGSEIIDDQNWTTYFIMNDFESTIFDAINKSKHKIMGPPALQQAVQLKEGLPSSHRPIYNYAMRGVITCFTGIRKKDELTRLVDLIHSMGGSIRKDMNSKVTHLICNTSGGDKYQYAMTFRLSVVRPSWVYDSWNRRNDSKYSATKEDITIANKLRAFEGLHICFLGFPLEEHQHMVEVLLMNGGIPTEIDDPQCTHVVIDEHAVQTMPELKNNKTHILKADWFWYTIQNGYADEQDYLFGDYLDSIANTPGGDRRDSLPISFNKRKRKRFSQRITNDGTPISGPGKRRSSVSDAGLLSVSGSFLDCTTSPDKHEGSKHITETEPTIIEQTTKNKSMRYNHFMDLFHTESNYVGILDTIVTLFKEPLEEKSDLDENEALLNKSEIKSIFSNFLPIHEVHKKMLNSLRDLQVNWSEDFLIGKIILDNRDDLIKAYPPYVNFFHQMKEALIHCDTQKPRFHAFLKINQAKPECGRQSLQDLMIRPVQRLPSISLLLNDILKHTSKSNPDHKKLDEALKAIKEVMTYINEDKRKTEGQLAMFDIFNDIECCPPHLVSSHRSFVSKCEVTELSDNLSGRGDSLIVFLFSDTLEVCKKRSRGFNSTKSPNNILNSTRHHHGNIQTTKPYKHIKLMPLSSIRAVIDIKDSSRAFAITCRTNQDTKEKLYSFMICDEEIDKIIYLKKFCKQLAENACRTDTDKFMTSYVASDLDIDISDVNVGTLSKAFKFATRTRLKVGRAFSFNKTPSKLKRTVSTMMASPFGSTQSLTPTSQLQHLKLASCNNINEVGEEDDSDNSPTSSEVLIAPMSVQPIRKVKCSTFSLKKL